MYRCVATSVAGFVQQLAVSYIAHGYWFYVTGRIPEPKDPAAIDRKLIERYGLEVSKFTRARHKRLGQARVQYLRYDRFFVLIATHGEHSFFTAEAGQIRDVRQAPVHFQGYTIGCRHGQGQWHPSVRIEREVHRELKARCVAIALQRSVEELWREFQAIPFEPYAPVRDQLHSILRAVNRRRHAAGLEPVPFAALRWRRRLVRPFAGD